MGGSAALAPMEGMGVTGAGTDGSSVVLTRESGRPAIARAQSRAATRRGLMFAPLLTPLLAALPFELLSSPAQAINPAETQVILPDQYQWKTWPGGPGRCDR